MHGLEKLEKEVWKRNIQADYHDWVDSMDLTLFKTLCRDHLGNKFIPQ